MWISENYGDQIYMVIWYKWKIIHNTHQYPLAFPIWFRTIFFLLGHWGHASPSVDKTILEGIIYQIFTESLVAQLTLPGVFNEYVEDSNPPFSQLSKLSKKKNYQNFKMNWHPELAIDG